MQDRARLAPYISDLHSRMDVRTFSSRSSLDDLLSQSGIYVVRTSRLHMRGEPLYKIGSTINFGQRFVGLAAGSPIPLEVVTIFGTRNKSNWRGGEMKKMAERILHEEFIQERQHSEWFRLHDDDLVLLPRCPDPIRGMVLTCGWQPVSPLGPHVG